MLQQNKTQRCFFLFFFFFYFFAAPGSFLKYETLSPSAIPRGGTQPSPPYSTTRIGFDALRHSHLVVVAELFLFCINIYTNPVEFIEEFQRIS